ncbi:MAG: hypothetical protein NT176_17220, partial [Proteobacteria bacterium]|nr:hypothetical protein [Pseudomonadota bacterium]
MTQTREAAFPGQPVADPAQWTGADLAANPRWIFPLEDEDIGALRGTARSVRTQIGDDPNKLIA